MGGKAVDRRRGPIERSNRRRAETEDFGERFGNDYGYGREGSHVEPSARWRTEESEYVERYSPPEHSSLGETSGPYSGVGPKNYRRTDERIREEVCERLTRHGQIDARGIDLDVRDGEVILRGVVPDRRTKRMAEELAESVAGVQDVNNELRLQNRAG